MSYRLVNHHVLDALKQLPRAIKHDFIITYKGEPLNARFSLKKQFSDTCKKAEITHGRKEGITFHDIRRTVKTNMVLAGIDKVYRDTILGHSLRGMDVNYIAPTDNALTKAMQRYTNWLDGQLKKQNVDQRVDQKHKKDCNFITTGIKTLTVGHLRGICSLRDLFNYSLQKLFA